MELERNTISLAESTHHGRSSRLALLLVLTAVWSFTLSIAEAGGPAEPKVDFNREIRPILAEKCFLCHGPDPKNRKGNAKGGLRLDTKEGAFADLGGHSAVVPGKPDESEILARIGSQDPEEVMPPASSGKKTTPREIEVLRAWVRQGAPYAKHWAYLAPVRSPLPDVKRSDWSKNAVDRFILERLERDGLNPSPEADRHALIRRVSLDLNG